MQNMTQLFRTIVDAFTSFQQPDFNATEKAYTRQFYSIYAQYGNGGLLLTLVLCADVDLDLWKQLVSKVILSDVIDTLMPAIEATNRSYPYHLPRNRKRTKLFRSFYQHRHLFKIPIHPAKGSNSKAQGSHIVTC